VIEGIIRCVKWVNGGERESILVEVVNDIKSGTDDDDPIVFNKLVFCMDVVKELSTGGKLKGEVIFCMRLKVLVKLDLGWLV